MARLRNHRRSESDTRDQMNFTQTAFFVLLAFALASVAITTRTEIRKLIILGCSFVFYGWWDWRFSRPRSCVDNDRFSGRPAHRVRSAKRR
jgi:hypothetical protein